MSDQISQKETGASRDLVSLNSLEKVAPLLLMSLAGCKAPENNTQLSLAEIIEDQRAKETPFASYKFSPDQAPYINLDSKSLSENLGKGSAVKEIYVYTAIGETEQPVIVRDVTFENGESYALFETKDGDTNPQFIPYESGFGFLTDMSDGKLTLANFIKIEKDGKTSVIPFFEVKSKLQSDSVDQSLIEKAGAGNQEAFDEILKNFGDRNNIESIQTSNLVTNNALKQEPGSKNWDRALDNIVGIISGAKPAQAAQGPITTETPVATETSVATENPVIQTQAPIVTETPTLTPEQQLVEYMKTPDAQKSVNKFKETMNGYGFEFASNNIEFRTINDKLSYAYLSVAKINENKAKEIFGEYAGFSSLFDGDYPIALIVKDANSGNWTILKNGGSPKDALSNGQVNPLLYLAHANSIQIGNSADLGSTRGTTNYKEALVFNSDIIEPDTSYLETRGDPNDMDFFLDIAAKYDKSIIITHGFFREDTEGITINDDYMNNRAQKLVEYASKSADMGVPIHISVAAEAFGKNGEWNKGDPFYKVYGRNYLIKSFSVFYEALNNENKKRIESGKSELILGDQLTFGYSDDYLEASPSKVNVINKELALVQKMLQEKYGVFIPIDTYSEGHLHADAGNKRGWDTLYALNLIKTPDKVYNNILSLAKGAKDRNSTLKFTEIDVSQNVPIPVRSGTVGSLLNMILKINSEDTSYSLIQSITLYVALDPSGWNPGLFIDSDFNNPELTYWLYQKLLLENLQK